MFEGAFLRREFPWHSNACAPLLRLLELNSTAASEGGLADRSCNQKDVRMSAVFLPVSLVGLALSLLSTALFLRQTQRTAFRASQLSLSLVMSLYLLFSAVDFANVLAGACLYWSQPSRHAQVVLGALACVLVDGLLCLRNWCTALIAAQRAEAVAFPLRPRKLLDGRNFRVSLLAIALVLCLPLALIRSLAEALVVCHGADGAVASVGYPLSERQSAGLELSHQRHYNYLLESAWFEPFEVYVFFSAQTVLPVAAVTCLSLSMAATMLCRRGAAGQALQATTQTRSCKRNKARASRTVLSLAVIFTLLQAPVFVGTLLRHAGAFDVESPFGKHFQFIAELCLLLDSIFNTFVYAYYVPDFRRFFRGLLHRRNRLPAAAAAAATAGPAAAAASSRGRPSGRTAEARQAIELRPLTVSTV